MEIHTVGVDNASAATGVDSVGVVEPVDPVDPDWPGEVLESAGWTG